MSKSKTCNEKLQRARSEGRHFSLLRKCFLFFSTRGPSLFETFSCIFHSFYIYRAAADKSSRPTDRAIAAAAAAAFRARRAGPRAAAAGIRMELTSAFDFNFVSLHRALNLCFLRKKKNTRRRRRRRRRGGVSYEKEINKSMMTSRSAARRQSEGISILRLISSFLLLLIFSQKFLP